jgi:hypothetical protein
MMNILDKRPKPLVLPVRRNGNKYINARVLKIFYIDGNRQRRIGFEGLLDGSTRVETYYENQVRKADVGPLVALAFLQEEVDLQEQADRDRRYACAVNIKISTDMDPNGLRWCVGFQVFTKPAQGMMVVTKNGSVQCHIQELLQRGLTGWVTVFPQDVVAIVLLDGDQTPPVSYTMILDFVRSRTVIGRSSYGPIEVGVVLDGEPAQYWKDVMHE